MTEDGEQEQDTKSEIEAVLDAVHTDEDDDADAAKDEDEGPENVHLGSYSSSQSNWDEAADRETKS